MLRILAAVVALLAVGGYGWYTLKEIIMTTKDEVLAQLEDVKAQQAEAAKDTQRLVAGVGDLSTQLNDVKAQLEQAVANNDLSAVSAGIDQLSQSIQATDALVESASPEPTTDTPADGGTGDEPVSDQPNL